MTAEDICWWFQAAGSWRELARVDDGTIQFQTGQDLPEGLALVVTVTRDAPTMQPREWRVRAALVASKGATRPLTDEDGIGVASLRDLGIVVGGIGPHSYGHVVAAMCDLCGLSLPDWLRGTPQGDIRVL